MRSILFLLFLTAAYSQAANLIPNSSFECGTENWFAYGTCCAVESGNDTSTPGRRSLTNVVHGNYSMAAPRTRLYTQQLYLLAGNYVETYSMKTDTGGAIINTIASDDYISNGTNGCSNPNPTITTTMARYTNFLTISSNGYYSLKWYRSSTTPIQWIDAVQLETGIVATAYAPMSQVEIGLTTTNLAHMLRSANPQYIQGQVWNEGSTLGATGVVQIFDYDNTNSFSTTVSSNAWPAGGTTVNILLSQRQGWQRAVVYQPALNSSLYELIYSVLPYPAGTAYNTNAPLGTHPSYGVSAQRFALEAGYTMARDLSPAACVRWSAEQPGGTGPYTFDPYCASFMTTNGMKAIFVLNQKVNANNAWPAGATNAAGLCDTNAWYVYCYTNAIHYSPAPSNASIFEIGNEWQGMTTNNCPMDFSLSASNTARFQVVGAQAVKDACPNCTTVVMAGENTGLRAFQIWTNMTNMTLGSTANFDIISAHHYPVNAGASNPNNTDDDLSTSSSSSQPWAQYFLPIGKPLWNTEMGNQGAKGGNLVLFNLIEPIYQVYGTLTPEAGRDYGSGQRKVVPVFRESHQIFRDLGVGFTKVIAYTAQETDTDIYSDQAYNAGVWEFSGALRQGAVAGLIAANRFAKNAGSGRVTNQTTINLETYLFTNDLGTVLALWRSDGVECTVTPTNGHWGRWDVMGNFLGTNEASFRIGKAAQILVSGDLTRNQMVTNLMFADVVTYTDVDGPNVSIDATPIGQTTGPDTYFFKWTITDRNKQVWSIGATNIYQPDETNNRSRIKFYAEDTWKEWGVSNHAFYTLPGNRQYNLFVEGKDFYNNVTTNIGPSFGLLGVMTPQIPSSTISGRTTISGRVTTQ